LYLRIKFAALFSKKSQFQREIKGNQLFSLQKQQSMRKEPYRIESKLDMVVQSIQGLPGRLKGND